MTSTRRNGPPSQKELGKRVFAEMVGFNYIELYEKCFVKVTGMKARFPERLLAIESSGDLTRKSGFGRAVGAGLTLGTSLISAANKGSLTLTIVTENDTYVLSPRPTTGNVDSVHRLVSAGKATLAAREAADRLAGQSSKSEDSKPSNELAKLQELRNAGVLSREEFVAAKARLLGEKTEQAGSIPDRSGKQEAGLTGEHHGSNGGGSQVEADVGVDLAARQEQVLVGGEAFTLEIWRIKAEARLVSRCVIGAFGELGLTHQASETALTNLSGQSLATIGYLVNGKVQIGIKADSSSTDLSLLIPSDDSAFSSVFIRSLTSWIRDIGTS